VTEVDDVVAGPSQASAGVAELPNATSNVALLTSVGCENVSVNCTAGSYKTVLPGQLEAFEVVFVTGPSVTVSPEPMFTGLPGVAVVVGAVVGATVVNFVGPGGGAVTVAAGAVAEAFAGVGFTVGFAAGFAVDCPVEPPEVPAAATAEANALAAAESAGGETAMPGDEIAGLGSVLDAAAAAGPDDAALLLCDELEHPERASAATTVTPINPVRRTRTVMAFPPAGMRQQ
jgi:hypothetical protein